ncbi:hypothetical protein FE782_22625 [Paenibacillus antri]|uniref:Uncharacterized protein n=1 Tax=Paenibacillus antri TaxID=2582848 RepID=A0A5R9G638_9BACL|nr:hypothetical protein [Paenibacillus antri]TLS49806.1 hypothetical protein FE782_22625 [Paenibacillus antri]
MKRIKIVISALLLLITLSACTSDIESETHDSIFQVGVDELKNVKANEAFEIIGYLKNKSKRTLEVSHGSGMFTYEIYNEDGDQILPNTTIFIRNDIGYMVELKADEEYRNNGEGQRSKEYYEFVIHEPGYYKVKMHVEFSINNEGKQEQINISSDLKEFKVE